MVRPPPTRAEIDFEAARPRFDFARADLPLVERARVFTALDFFAVDFLAPAFLELDLLLLVRALLREVPADFDRAPPLLFLPPLALRLTDARRPPPANLPDLAALFFFAPELLPAIFRPPRLDLLAAADFLAPEDLRAEVLVDDFLAGAEATFALAFAPLDFRALLLPDDLPRIPITFVAAVAT